MNEFNQPMRKKLNELIYVVKDLEVDTEIKELIIELAAVLRKYKINIIAEGVTLLLALAVLNAKKFTAIVKVLNDVVLMEHYERMKKKE